jgi:adenylate kinase family enzyme
LNRRSVPWIIRMMIARIHIIGPAGSGKTFAAGKLARRLDIPAHDLDELFWDKANPGYSRKADPVVRDAMLGDILRSERWIIEGVYLSWVEAGFSRADRIILLDVGVWTCARRIIRRFILRRIGMLQSNKRETIKGLKELLAWNRKYITERIPRIKLVLAGSEHKTNISKSAEEVVVALRSG